MTVQSKERAYTIVVAWNVKDKYCELLFGDYDREVAKQERADLKDNDHDGEYIKYRIYTLANGEQATINSFLAQLKIK